MRIVIIIVVALLLIAGGGGAYLYFMKPEALNKLAGREIAPQDSSHTALADFPFVDSLSVTATSLTDSLRIKLAWYENQLLRKMREADSLRNLVNQYAAKDATQQKSKAAGTAEAGTIAPDNAKELAITFAAMNVKELAPILSDLDNQSIIRLYQNMNSRSRKNIFVGLPKTRAAEITKELLAQAGN